MPHNCINLLTEFWTWHSLMRRSLATFNTGRSTDPCITAGIEFFLAPFLPLSPFDPEVVGSALYLLKLSAATFLNLWGSSSAGVGGVLSPEVRLNGPG